jgi:hypothetical protein
MMTSMQWHNLLSIGLLLVLAGCNCRDRQMLPQHSPPAFTGTTYSIPAGTVGIVSIERETPDNYQLKIIFPNIVAPESPSQHRDPIWLRKNDTVRLSNSLQLFNDAGEVAKIAKMLPVKIDRWCQNDGGIQYRSTVDLILPKRDLRSPLHKFSRVENFALFAVVGKIEELAPVSTSVVNTGTGQHQITRTLILEGRQPPTNRLVTRVFEEGNPQWDGCGNGEERPSLILETAHSKSNLRCCGP